MVDLNHVVLIGRLTRDAELKSTAGGFSICKFSIAVNRRRKSGDQWEDEASFFDIVVWGRQGESLHQYLVKGKMVAIDGELRQERWQHEGQNRSKVEVIANHLQLLGGSNNNRDQGDNDDRSGQQNSEKSQTRYQENDDNFTDEIPF